MWLRRVICWPLWPQRCCLFGNRLLLLAPDLTPNPLNHPVFRHTLNMESNHVCMTSLTTYTDEFRTRYFLFELYVPFLFLENKTFFKDARSSQPLYLLSFCHLKAMMKEIV